MTVLALAVGGRGLVDPNEPVLHADDDAFLRGRLIRCRSNASGTGTRPGPPSTTQRLSTSTAYPSSSPNQTGRPPATRPAGDGRTTTTLACSHGPRHSLVRTVTVAGWSAATRRSTANCASWSVAGALAGLPQQHPRHTTIPARPACGTCPPLCLV